MANALHGAQTSLHERANSAIIMLTVQFLSGMAVNLIGLPSEVSGGAKVASSIFVGLHALVALGLTVGAVLTWHLARKIGGRLATLGNATAGAILVTLIAGLLDVTTKSNWWSYLMAVGFVASFLLYGAIFVQTPRKNHQ